MTRGARRLRTSVVALALASACVSDLSVGVYEDSIEEAPEGGLPEGTTRDAGPRDAGQPGPVDPEPEYDPDIDAGGYFVICDSRRCDPAELAALSCRQGNACVRTSDTRCSFMCLPLIAVTRQDGGSFPPPTTTPLVPTPADAGTASDAGAP